MSESLSILSEKNVVDMLLFLLPSKRKENDFIEIVSNYYSINATLNKLVSAGLATVQLQYSDKGKRYSARFYELTPLGHDVATDLKRANDRLNSISPQALPVAVPETPPAPQPPRQLMDPGLSLVLRVIYERQHLTFAELSGYTKLADAELRPDINILVANGSVRTEGDQYLITEDGAKRARHVIAMENGQDVVQVDFEEPAGSGTATKGSG